MRSLFYLSIALAGLMLVGCGNSPRSIDGKVNYQGAPLPAGSITFEPVEEGHRASGTIENGQIVGITTFKAGDGLLPGEYRVSITAATNTDDMYAEHKSLIPERYGNPATSSLTATIPPTGDLIFELTP